MYDKFVEFYNNYFKNHTNSNFLLVDNIKLSNITIKL